jgi:anthranilate phosphoribosyltransferase
MLLARDALQKLLGRIDFTREEMLDVMHQIMAGQLTSAQIAGILIALRMKGETVDEIAAAAEVMRELSIKVNVATDEYLIDTCGTGGASSKTFNVSTCAAFVAAGAGARIAKHGNRAASSKSGSADVLEALGVNINVTPNQVARFVEEIGIGFMFARNYHSAMKHVAPVRSELGVRTLFNLLGPLTNPAGAKRQIIGVFDKSLTGKLAHVLKRLGSQHVLVVHGAEGMDEISFSGDTYVAELKDGVVTEYVINPQMFGLPVHDVQSISVQNAEESKLMILAVLSGQKNNPQHSAARDIVLLNAGAAIYVAGLVTNLAEGIKSAALMIDSGAALNKLNQFTALSQQVA